MSNKENTKDSSKELIIIQILDSKNNPINNAKITLLAMGQKAGQKILLDTPTDSNGKTLFNSKPYLKDINRFEITINHPDYYSYPINRNRKICRSYEYGHLCVERFEKIPSFYYNGKTLNISQCPNPTKKYALKNPLNQASNNQTQYYTQLQENQKSFKIYKDENLTQEGGYTLCLDTQNAQAESAQSQSNTTTILNFDSKEILERFTKDIQELITKDKKKGNIGLVHGFVIELVPLSVISLHFNGKLLTIIINEGDIIQSISFQAVSGRAQKVADKHHFTYEKERQMLKNEGPIPEGEYYITPLSENIDDGVQEWDNLTNIDKLLAYTGRGKWGGRIYDWGTIRIPIQPKIVTLTDSKGQLITRNNFFIHGGAEAGSAGCVDLWDKNELFFEKFLHYVEKYKEEILNNQGKIPLIVKYENNTIMECDNDFYTKYCKPID